MRQDLIGNVRGAKHGGRSTRPGFVVAHLAGNYRSIEADLHTLRRELETETRQARGLPLKGPLPVRLHSLIDLAVSYERCHRLGQVAANKAGNWDERLGRERTATWGAQMRHATIERLLSDAEPGSHADPLTAALAAAQGPLDDNDFGIAPPAESPPGASVGDGIADPETENNQP